MRDALETEIENSRELIRNWKADDTFKDPYKAKDIAQQEAYIAEKQREIENYDKLVGGSREPSYPFPG